MTRIRLLDDLRVGPVRGKRGDERSVDLRDALRLVNSGQAERVIDRSTDTERAVP